ncbi:hypothetical protein EJB05_05642, partial [Eragrostis curvula]
MATSRTRHFVLFPFPGHGHLAGFLAIARLLRQELPDAAVTLVSTPRNVATLRASETTSIISFHYQLPLSASTWKWFILFVLTDMDFVFVNIANMNFRLAQCLSNIIVVGEMAATMNSEGLENTARHKLNNKDEAEAGTDVRDDAEGSLIHAKGKSYKAKANKGSCEG